MLLYTGTSDGNMEEGSLRCDANVSVRPAGQTRLGTKVEVKNLNSFRNLAKSIDYEIERQIGRLESGQDVVQETRTFDAATGITRPMRGKEEAHDYRYFPEPDLPPLVLAAERVESLRRALPELPWERRARFGAEYGLSLDDARLLTSTPELADYFEAAVRHHPGNPKAIANWVMTEVLRELKARHATVAAALAPERLARLVEMVDRGALSGRGAKEVLAAIWEGGEEPAAAMRAARPHAGARRGRDRRLGRRRAARAPGAGGAVPGREDQGARVPGRRGDEAFERTGGPAAGARPAGADTRETRRTVPKRRWPRRGRSAPD